MKKALITGITGQDGSYLAELLINKGYDVYGFMRRSSTEPLMRFQDIAFKRKIQLLYGNVTESGSLRRAMEQVEPDEVYNLAAQSDVGISFLIPEETEEINYYGVGKVVNEALRVNPRVRIYQASTSEMYGKTKPPQSETSPFEPVSPYAEAKLKAHEDFVVGYRDKQGAFISSGILFNHESPRRGKHFVTRKITHSLAKVKLGMQDYVTLGNLDAKRDWGFAGDYVEAMWMMLQQDKPGDYVIATGESRSVREFVEATIRALGKTITWEGKGLDEVGRDEKGNIIVKVSEEFFRPAEVHYLCGDITKAQRELGWSPRVNFDELVAMMVESDLKDVKYEAMKKLIAS